MQIIDKFTAIDSEASIVTIGKFDGLHIGHMAIIDNLIKPSNNSLSKLVVSFVNHPDTVLSDSFAGNIITENEKQDILDKLGIDYYCALVFDDELKNTECEYFFEQYIIKQWKCKCLVVGDDFKFGKNRRGNLEFLKNECLKYNIELIVVNRLQFENEPISSSRIKDCIINSDISYANKMLGYNYELTGTVIKGNQLGRTIDFPTANLAPDKMKVLPKNGVYKTIVLYKGIGYKAITNIGIKPTIEKKSDLVIETHILDEALDLYGKTIKVEFIKYLRSETKFESLDALKNQLLIDKKCWTN